MWGCAGECGEGLAALFLMWIWELDRLVTGWTPEGAGFDARTIKWEASAPIRPVIRLVFLKVEMAHFKLVAIAEA